MFFLGNLGNKGNKPKDVPTEWQIKKINISFPKDKSFCEFL